MIHINNEGTIIHIIPKKIEWVMGLRLLGESSSKSNSINMAKRPVTKIP
jgi:hypothetical protein